MSTDDDDYYRETGNQTMSTDDDDYYYEEGMDAIFNGYDSNASPIGDEEGTSAKNDDNKNERTSKTVKPPKTTNKDNCVQYTNKVCTPFTYKGVSYDDCIAVEDYFYSWCLVDGQTGIGDDYSMCGKCKNPEQTNDYKNERTSKTVKPLTTTSKDNYPTARNHPESENLDYEFLYMSYKRVKGALPENIFSRKLLRRMLKNILFRRNSKNWKGFLAVEIV